MIAGMIKLLGDRGWSVVSQIPNILQCKTCNFACALNRPRVSLSPVLFRTFNQKSLLQYRQLNPQTSHISKLLEPNQKQLKFLNGLPKSFFFGKNDKHPKEKKRKVPKLILVQNPFKWLKIKLDFCILRNIWDPSFKEKEFKFGTQQAISRITQVISTGQYAELNGLLTKAARQSLLRELERNWSDRHRTLLTLNREDIQITSPRNVHFIKIDNKKFCDVDMSFLALKWVPINYSEVLIFTEIFARFHREYTPHCIPEWTIAYFKITRFKALRKS